MYYNIVGLGLGIAVVGVMLWAFRKPEEQSIRQVEEDAERLRQWTEAERRKI